jgi:mono/diheme cytochrome c family protein
MRMRFSTKRVMLTTALAIFSWTGMPRPAAAQDAAQVKRGQEVYTAQKCMVCHSISGKGAKTSPLDGVGKKLTAAEIREWIVSPTEMAKKAKSTRKPPMQDKYGTLPAADIDGLVAYMQSLQ